MKRAASEKGLVTCYELSESCKGPIFIGDAYRIQQILANFAWNSMKARDNEKTTKTHTSRSCLHVMLSYLLSVSLCCVFPYVVFAPQISPLALSAPRFHPHSSSPQFTSEGSVTISVDAVPLPADDPRRHNHMRVFFKCIDTGCGMEPSMQARLFQAFEMANPSRISKYGGSGLGLNICRALASLLGARIHCISTPGALRKKGREKPHPDRPVIGPNQVIGIKKSIER